MDHIFSNSLHKPTLIALLARVPEITWIFSVVKKPYVILPSLHGAKNFCLVCFCPHFILRYPYTPPFPPSKRPKCNSNFRHPTKRRGCWRRRLPGPNMVDVNLEGRGGLVKNHTLLYFEVQASVDRLEKPGDQSDASGDESVSASKKI